VVPSADQAAVAQSVRQLSDVDLIAALKNVGCHLEGCDACAEVFFTGGAMHRHTCKEDAGVQLSSE
jgi:hypothetical protein